MKLFTKDFFLLSVDKDNTIKSIRIKLLFWMLILINTLAVPTLIIAIIEAVKLDLSYTAFLYTSFYLPVFFALIFRKKISYTSGVVMLLLSCYVLGGINVWVYGFSGAGLPLFYCLSVLAVIFLGLRAGIIAILACSVLMSIIAYLMINNILSVNIDLLLITKSPISWITAIMVMIFLGSIMVFGFGIIQQNLLYTLKVVRNQKDNLLSIKNKQAEDIDYLQRIKIELEKAKEKAEKSDLLKTAFLANMSHEIRTPMNGILGFAELLKEPELSGDQQQQYIQIIEKSGVRMLNIINDIVSISKIEAGIVDIVFVETNLNNQLRFIYNTFKLEADNKKIILTLTCGLSDDEAIIKTDNEKFFSILENLVKNAIKYTDTGSIEFGYVLKGVELEFYVKDSGIGIQKEMCEVIFERFIKTDIADMKARQGAGLGLSIAKAYVSILGGRIWAESLEGKGSAFFFTLPFNLDA